MSVDPATTLAPFDPHDVRARVDAALLAVLDASNRDARARAHEALPVLEQVRAITLRGGKRLRAVLVAAAAECVTPWETLAPAVVAGGAALELLQTYLLVHDDWMDGDRTRRGGPAAHVALAERYHDARRGETLAVLAGDLAAALSLECLAAAPAPPDRLAAAMRAFGRLQRDVVLGQTLDVLGSSDQSAVLDLKTGSYTVRGPLALGHALAGGSDSAWERMLDFAMPLGAAFQLRDDLLGAFGDERVTGKPSGADLRAGRLTAPVATALELLDEAGQRELRGLLGRDDDHAVAQARAMMEECGAARAVEARVNALRDEGLRALDSPALRASGREALTSLAVALTDRRA